MVSWCQWLVAATDSLVLSAGCGRHESRTESPIHSEPRVKYNARESDSVVSIVAALQRTPLHTPASEYCKWLHTRTFWQGANKAQVKFYLDSHHGLYMYSRNKILSYHALQ